MLILDHKVAKIEFQPDNSLQSCVLKCQKNTYENVQACGMCLNNM